MKRAKPPMRAILREMREDSGALGTGPIGKEGVLEIFESERSHPGEVCALFTFSLSTDVDVAAPDVLEVPGQIWTSFSYILEEEGSTVRLLNGGKSGENYFVFEQIDPVTSGRHA